MEINLLIVPLIEIQNDVAALKKAKKMSLMASFRH
jgi:hypothetical protein